MEILVSNDDERISAAQVVTQGEVLDAEEVKVEAN